MVSSLTIWFIWKVRCKEVLEEKNEPPAKTELIHTLMGYDTIKGASDNVIKDLVTFNKLWQHDPFYVHKAGDLMSVCFTISSLMLPPLRWETTAHIWNLLDITSVMCFNHQISEFFELIERALFFVKSK
jgi:hypothetical protein